MATLKLKLIIRCFFRKSQDEKILVLIVYIDDILLTGDDTTEGKRIKKVLAKEFEIKDLGPMKYFLGMEVARSKKGIYVSQRKYIIDLLRETSFSKSKPANTPIEDVRPEKFQFLEKGYNRNFG